MAFNSSCFDANVLLEIILSRKQEQAARRAIKQAGSSSSISALTGHLVVHFGQERVSIPLLGQFLNDYEILPLEASDFEWAFNNIRGGDFEDALQLAVAIRHGCKQFLTLDSELYKIYRNLPTIQITHVT